MKVPERYRALGEPEVASGAASLIGIDTVTGLPVMIYRFPGEPRAQPGELHGEGIPRILWSGFEEGEGHLVAALAPGWRRWSQGEGPLESERLLEAVRALRDAAAAGVVHGDLHPGRLLLTGERLLLEGYGVPWRHERGDAPWRESGADPLADDVRALATTLAMVGTTTTDATLAAVLEQARADEPDERPSAEDLCLALESLLGGPGTADPVGVAAERPGPGRLPPLRQDPTPGRVAASPGGGAPAAQARAEEERGAGARAGEGGSLARPVGGGGPPSRPARAGGSTPHDRRQGGARRGAGAADGEGRRRLAMLGVLMASVIILALLARYGPQGGPPATTVSRKATVFVIEVFVEPADLPPVTVHLISSPPGSSLEQGGRLGTAPRHLALDRPGEWVFQGSLQDRRSELVRIRVPEERAMTLSIPPS